MHLVRSRKIRFIKAKAGTTHASQRSAGGQGQGVVVVPKLQYCDAVAYLLLGVVVPVARCVYSRLPRYFVSAD